MSKSAFSSSQLPIFKYYLVTQYHLFLVLLKLVNVLVQYLKPIRCEKNSFIFLAVDRIHVFIVLLPNALKFVKNKSITYVLSVMLCSWKQQNIFSQMG